MHLHGNEATESTSANVLFNTVKQLNLVKALDIFSFSNMKYQVCLKPNQNTTNLWMRNPQSNKKEKKRFNSKSIWLLWAKGQEGRQPPMRGFQVRYAWTHKLASMGVKCLMS